MAGQKPEESWSLADLENDGWHIVNISDLDQRIIPPPVAAAAPAQPIIDFPMTPDDAERFRQYRARHLGPVAPFAQAYCTGTSGSTIETASTAVSAGSSNKRANSSANISSVNKHPRNGAMTSQSTIASTNGQIQSHANAQRSNGRIPPVRRPFISCPATIVESDSKKPEAMGKAKSDSHIAYSSTA